MEITNTIIITICGLLLIGYLFDLSASRTKIPSVILLLMLGWGVRQFSDLLKIQIPNLDLILPVFGTIGLILIVLEGSLELDISKSKSKFIAKSFFVALFSMFAFSFAFAFLFQYFGQSSFKNCLINAIPLSVISSAIAIPSVKKLCSFDKEFVTYESSLSDIFGVIFFNFIALNETINSYTFGYFSLQLLIIIITSFIATLGLSLLLSKSKHHVKFVPILLFIILIYAISKVYHLPALVFIMIFGLFIGNLYKFEKSKWLQKFEPEKLYIEVHKFKDMVTEFAFLIRTFFFLLFGYLIETSEILNIQSMIWAFGIVAGIYFIRLIILKVTRLPLTPLLFIAPRGLITILLFLAIDPTQNISIVDKSLIIQVIIITALMMIVGLIKTPKLENN